MDFYKLWKVIKEDGDLNAYATSTDDDPNYRQQYMKKERLDIDKSLNLKRRLKKLNYCRK